MPKTRLSIDSVLCQNEYVMLKSNLSLFHQLLYPTKSWAVIFICALLIASELLVYVMGGTHAGYVHVFYIPIILSGLFFSTIGGVTTGIIAGLLLGPGMPSDVNLETVQPLHSWLTRVGFFTTVGLLSGLGSAIFRSYLRELTTKLTSNPITGLPNILGLQKQFKELIVQSADISVIVIEIHNFREIERAIGVSDTEGLVKQVAAKLAIDNISVGHPQISNFVLLTDEKVSLEDIQQTVGSVFTVNKIPIFAEIFYGLANYPHHDTTLHGLIRKAKLAIDKSEEKNQYLAIYDNKYADHSKENVQLLHELHQAIEGNRLVLHYQPKLDLKSNKITGAEALVRWPHPTRGLISPALFMPLVERTLLINPFTKWMVRHALSDMVAWHKQNIKINLALNCSMKNFHDASVFEELFALTEKYKIDPGHIIIEVTESAVTPNMQEVAEVLTTLRKKGFKIAIDDFGTGQASQQYLCELPIDIIKIDQMFVHKLGEGSAGEAIVQSAITLGHQLHLKVIAEGVETQEQLEKLKHLGCDIGQGYHIAKPMPSTELLQWIKTA